MKPGSDIGDIVFRYSFQGLDSPLYHDYVMHALCRRGSCTFTYNGQPMRMWAGDIAIRECRLFARFVPDDDFLVEIILISQKYLMANKDNNFAIKAQMELYLNPVIHLTSEQMMVCRANFRYVAYRLQHPEHRFYGEALSLAVQTMLTDIYDIHSQRHGHAELSQTYANILQQFVALLDAGHFRDHHDAEWFASRIFISAKHLAFVCRKATGFSATYWINRYLLVDIRERLFERRYSVKELAEQYHFSSASYFCRYVESGLGISPKNFQK